MFGRAQEFRLFDMFGVPVYMNWSFAIILLMFVLDAGLVRGLAFAAVLAFSVLLHEFGHIGMARRFGVRARRVTLSVIGGCASLDEIPRTPGGEFATALAGPLVSFVLGAVSWTLLVFTWPPPFFQLMLYYGTLLNFMLGAFNLLPGFPMDGGRVFRSIMMRFTSRARATWWAMVVGRATAVLLALWALRDVFRGGFPFITLLIVWMIWQEGRREYEIARAEEYWSGYWR